MNLSKDHLHIGLDAWIIQDGNYADFARGDCISFALEFYAAAPFAEKLKGSGASLKRTSGHRYAIEGQVLHVDCDWWVIDFGLLAFREEKPPSFAQVGQWIEGVIGIGVDPFFYSERLAATPNAPALMYEWAVEAIEIETAPFIVEGRTYRRDTSKQGWREIDKTAAWTDDDGSAEYLLRCRRIDRPARHRR